MGFWQKSRIPFWAVGTALGLLFLILGTMSGQLQDIWEKAVMICLECIGIG